MHFLYRSNICGDNELWANPQLIKPNVNFSISGKIKINYWPEGYENLRLNTVSTTNNSWYTLSLPILQRNKDI
jgi:hypothetical protein